MKATKTLLTFLKTHWLIAVIICVATWLRVWNLDTQGILFSDAGKDLLVAQQSWSEKKLPLLGIASSVPRFKQGPISIWIEMAVIALFGINTLAQSLTFALLSVLAVIGIYEFACIYISRKAALFAAALLATSPLAVANGRVPYHTTPLPLALVGYLFSLLLLWHKKRWGPFLSAFGFAFLFQFELAMAPLFFLIPFVIWQQRIKLTKNALVQLVTGIGLGLLPQIIFDLTHRFAQIGVFVLWIGHKIIGFITFSEGGSTGMQNYFSAVTTYGTRIFSTDHIWISLPFAAVILYGFFSAFRLWRKKKLEPAFLLVELSLFLLIVSYFVHGSPSEAYFPPFFILLPLHIAFTIVHTTQLVQKISIACAVLLCCFNIFSILRHSFFVSNPQSFSYGASTGEMRRILSFITTKSDGNYSLKTFSNDDETFASYFDNYIWLAHEMNIAQPKDGGSSFYIENQDIHTISSQHMLRTFDSRRVYWNWNTELLQR